MDISIYDRIPINFHIDDNIIYFKKIQKYILCKFNNDLYSVILDIRHYKETFKILDILKSLNLKYLLVSPHFLDPKNKRYSHEENISKNLYSLFYMYVNKDIFYYTNKKEIKLLEEIIRYYTSSGVEQHILKNVINDILIKVDDNYKCYYSNKYIYTVNDDIRDYFKSIWRKIQFILLFE